MTHQPDGTPHLDDATDPDRTPAPDGTPRPGGAVGSARGLRPEVLAYYQAGGETTRLRDGAGRLEFLRTWDVLSRWLPPPPADVLDVGGATGVYAGPLAAAGYRVCLVDPVPGHVRVAATLVGVTAVAGDARDLPVPADSADAVLLLGPLYHLTEPAQRVRAWAQASRAVRPGGLVVAATISRFAPLLDGFAQDFLADPRFAELVGAGLADGMHRNDHAVPAWFTTAYLHRPEQCAVEAGDAGLEPVATVAVEGPLWTLGARLDALLADPAGTERVLTWLRRVEAEPSLLGASAHLLTLARRPD